MEREILVYNGYNFYRYPNAKGRSERVYYSGRVIIDNKSVKIRLHVYKYICEVGDIPEGYDVHHIDEDYNNNEVYNFECILKSKHASYHALNASDDVKNKRIEALTSEENKIKASDWHKSEEGRNFHIKHASDINFGNFDFGERICEYCNVVYTAKKNNQNTCSANCRTQKRRVSGIDNESRVCVMCGNDFETNKYSKASCCSRSCGCTLRELNKKLH